jgi:hypothetical protein
MAAGSGRRIRTPVSYRETRRRGGPQTRHRCADPERHRPLLRREVPGRSPVRHLCPHRGPGRTHRGNPGIPRRPQCMAGNCRQGEGRLSRRSNLRLRSLPSGKLERPHSRHRQGHCGHGGISSDRHAKARAAPPRRPTLAVQHNPVTTYRPGEPVTIEARAEAPLDTSLPPRQPVGTLGGRVHEIRIPAPVLLRIRRRSPPRPGEGFHPSALLRHPPNHVNHVLPGLDFFVR